MDTDFKTQVMHLKDVTITYGKMTVKADRALATSGDFKNSRWTFDGNVRINADPRGNLRSDEAVVEFEDNQLKRATATGNPAEFDQKRADSDVIARGHADTDRLRSRRRNRRRSRLSNDAWITDGRNDIRGPGDRLQPPRGTRGGDDVPRHRSACTSRSRLTMRRRWMAPGTNKPKPTAAVHQRRRPALPPQRLHSSRPHRQSPAQSPTPLPANVAGDAPQPTPR